MARATRCDDDEGMSLWGTAGQNGYYLGGADMAGWARDLQMALYYYTTTTPRTVPQFNPVSLSLLWAAHFGERVAR